MIGRQDTTGLSAGSSFLDQLARLVFGAGSIALILPFLFLFVSASCASKPAISNVMLPLTQLKTLVLNNLPIGLREESMNGRELFSNYFTPSNIYVEAAEKPERAFAKVTILGSGRPYSLAVEVIRERKDKSTGRYKRLGQDHRLSRELANRLKTALADRREDRNVIDDFRAF